MEDTFYLYLPYLFCYFLDAPTNGTDCVQRETGWYCLKCPVNASFHAGGTVQNLSTSGHKVSIFIWILILLFGFLGALTNGLIIIILKKHHCTKSFEVLLFALACFDLITSLMTICSSTGFIAFLENWDRSYATLTWIFLAYFTTVLGRTGSTVMKVLITAERYVFISRPEAAGMWLSKGKTKLLALAVLGVSIILNLPRYLSIRVVKLEDNFANISRLKELHVKYVMTDRLGDSWLATWKEISVQIDSWVPFPLLIFFCVLIYFEIKKITSKKRAMQVTRKKDIREVKMFIPVIIILFICNIFPVVHYMTMKITKVIYREHVLGTILFVAVSSAANLPIYICRGTTFRKEARSLVYKITNRIG